MLMSPICNGEIASAQGRPQKAGEGAVGIAHMARVAKCQLCNLLSKGHAQLMSYVALVFVFPLPRPLGAVPWVLVSCSSSCAGLLTCWLCCFKLRPMSPHRVD